jgi:hypothetical protein
MDYKLVVFDGKFAVEEVSSGLIMDKFNSVDDARNLVDMLNNGCGFSGFSPVFFAKGVQVNLQ